MRASGGGSSRRGRQFSVRTPPHGKSDARGSGVARQGVRRKRGAMAGIVTSGVAPSNDGLMSPKPPATGIPWIGVCCTSTTADKEKRRTSLPCRSSRIALLMNGVPYPADRRHTSAIWEDKNKTTSPSSRKEKSQQISMGRTCLHRYDQTGGIRSRQRFSTAKEIYHFKKPLLLVAQVVPPR